MKVATLAARTSTGAPLAWLTVSAAFAYCYWDVFRLLTWQWQTNDVYSYAFLIPPVSAYILWTKRAAIVRATGIPSCRAGLPVLGFGLSLLVLGRAGGFSTLQELSLLVTLAGLVLLIGGERLLGVVWVPLAYLAFTIPVWDAFTERFHWPFQLLSARIAEAILFLAQVPTYRIDAILHLPTVTLEVARACSGVNYLISIVAVAVPYAYFSIARPLRRIAVVGIAVLVAITSNGLRVAFIGGLQYYGLSNSADLHGPNHVLQGMFVAVVGYLALFAAAWFLRERQAAAPIPAGQPPPAGMEGPRRGPWPAPAIIALVALGCVGVFRPFSDVRPVPLNRGDMLPASVGGWSAASGDAGSTPVRAPGADAEWSRRYRNDAFGSIEVYLGYFSSQRTGRKLVGEGGVVLPKPASRSPLALPSGREASVAESETDLDGGRRRLVLAWYDVNGRVTAHPFIAKLLLVRNAVAHRRSNGAVVVLTFETSREPKHARAELRRFGGQILPMMQRTLWTERSR